MCNKTGISVTPGQSELSASACRQFTESNAVDIIYPDALASGGPLSGGRFSLGRRAHYLDGPPRRATHLDAPALFRSKRTLSEAFYPDVDLVWYELVAEKSKISDGRLSLSDVAEINVTLDESLVEEYA